MKLPVLRLEGREIGYVDISAAVERHGRAVGELPYAVRVLIENVERSRRLDPSGPASDDDVAALVAFAANPGRGVPLDVPRVIVPDSSGIPVLQDMAALRDVVAAHGRDPGVVKPRVQMDIVIDHSVQVDCVGTPGALAQNMRIERERNAERYRFLRWSEGAFEGLRLFPPGSGIIHQINLEFIAEVVLLRSRDGQEVALPDFVVGGDSHTPMVNGLGVLGWGAGGIDIEAAALGLPYDFSIPDVVGVRLDGALPAGTTTTDLVLHLTERLRHEGVVGALVEFFGPGVAQLSVPERATLANMSPEYGATIGYFPVDARTVEYLATTRGRSLAARVETYARANALFRDPDAAEPAYPRVVAFDLGGVEPSVAGPRRPQDRLPLAAVGADFTARLPRSFADGGFNAETAGPATEGQLGHGAIAIAAITSCTNTSNPSVMLAAGLVARKAVELGLDVPPHVKTSLAPGSRAVTRYLEETGLLGPLESLGFFVVGYGCTTCAGKSGPLVDDMAEAIRERGLVAAAVLSGNRNFEGRIHRLVRAAYLMSPPLVVAYALAGRVDLDLTRDPVGKDREGRPVTLADLWPDPAELADVVATAGRPGLISETYAQLGGRDLWRKIEAPVGALYPWVPGSDYLVEPPFFRIDPERAAAAMDDLTGARVLGLFGDSLTTDHISPGGEIPPESPAGRYLVDKGVKQSDFNSYVGRRGNFEVMVRATFANVRIRNQLLPESEGGVTRHLPGGETMTIHEAAQAYGRDGTPVIVVAGKEYGTGSSRDWAARGQFLLGVRAVIAESFERIHRSNLVGVGIVPLRFRDGQGWRSLGLDGTETYEITGVAAGVLKGEPVEVVARKGEAAVTFKVDADIRTESERRLMAGGGMSGVVLEHLGVLPERTESGHA